MRETRVVCLTTASVPEAMLLYFLNICVSSRMETLDSSFPHCFSHFFPHLFCLPANYVSSASLTNSVLIHPDFFAFFTPLYCGLPHQFQLLYMGFLLVL